MPCSDLKPSHTFPGVAPPFGWHNGHPPRRKVGICGISSCCRAAGGKAAFFSGLEETDGKLQHCSWLSFNGCLGFLSEFPGVQQGSWIANGLATGYKLNVLTPKLQGPVLKTDLARPPVLQPYSTKAYVHSHI